MIRPARHQYTFESENPVFVVSRCRVCTLRRRHGEAKGYRTPMFFVQGAWVRRTPFSGCPGRAYDWEHRQPIPGALPPDPAPPSPQMDSQEFVRRVDRVVQFSLVHIARVVQQIHQKWRQEMKR